MASRWQFLLDHHLPLLCRDEGDLWVEEFTFLPGHAFERIVGIVLKESTDSFYVALPSVPLVEARMTAGRAKDVSISLSVEMLKTAPILRVYKSNLVYSSCPAKEILLGFLRLLVENQDDLDDLHFVLRNTELYHAWDCNAESLMAGIMDEMRDIEEECARRPEVLSEEGIEHIKQTVLDIDFSGDEEDTPKESEAPGHGNKTLH